MATAHASIVVRHLRSLVTAERTGHLPDHVLLERFTRGREEGAFASLVRRHGPLVLGVCRRVLHNQHDAEDAFQATFLVLARKAASVGKQGSLAGWLYQVAYHLAIKARAQAVNRQQYEKQFSSRPAADPLEELTGRELLRVLDEELQDLPDRYRTPLVLCYLEGQTRDQAAHQLGWSVRTLHRRLEEGKERLRFRLARRGMALPAGLLAAGLTQGAATAAVPATLVHATVQAAALTAAGHAAGAGVVSASAVALADTATKALAATKIKIAAASLLAFALVAGGMAALTHRVFANRQDQAIAPPAPANNESKPKQREKKPVAAPDHKKPPDEERMTVTGRVLDPAGKPLAAAQVAVLARQGLQLSSWENWASHRNEVLSQTKTDAEGRFRMAVQRMPATMSVRQIRVIAASAGYGLAWKAIDPDAAQAEAEVRLAPEQVVRGHFIDLQGQPAARVKVHVIRVTRQHQKGERDDDAGLRVPADGFPFGPRTATTDAKGDFVLRGLAPGMKVELELRDPRYERTDDWIIDTADKQKCENIRKVLGSGYSVEGRVIYQDTRKPVPHARLEIANPVAGGKADADGRFRISIYPPAKGVGGVGIRAWPPEGDPYLTAWTGLDFPKGVVRREVEIVLPRAVLVHGKITEAGSGKPVAGAYVEHGAWWNNRAVSGPDGSYQIGVPAGKGRLFVVHPSGDYTPQVLG
ncbi:MAG TPA: sigma-70 family RNA polymerase sigma factor, partial [Gemmataceae bacterium]|nr:sigma-70 family RNA polymerase sigma factor [Gemmataceae bacterium]